MARTARSLLHQMAVCAVVLVVATAHSQRPIVQLERPSSGEMRPAGCVPLRAAVDGLPSRLATAKSPPAVAAVATRARDTLQHLPVTGPLRHTVDELVAGIDQWAGLVALRGTSVVRGAGLFSRLAVALSELSRSCPTGRTAEPLVASGAPASGARRA